eukprot:1445742-Alexandrium_andersonii.AAC.1
MRACPLSDYKSGCACVCVCAHASAPSNFCCPARVSAGICVPRCAQAGSGTWKRKAGGDSASGDSAGPRHAPR